MRLLVLALLAALLVGCGRKALPTDETKAPNEGPPKKEPPPKQKGETARQKGLLVLTPAAAAKVKQIIREGQAEGQLPRETLYLRLRVEGGNKLDLDPAVDPKEDEVGESLGVLTVVNRTHAKSIEPGTVIDFDEAQQGFKVSAPASVEVELGPPDEKTTLAEARRDFRTNLRRRNEPGEAPAAPPGLFSLVKYDSPAGKLHAYLTPDPKDGKKRPAIVWITGGDCNTIDQGCWREGEGGNDQSASAYRKAGLVMMFPSQRGGNDNPGPKEAFLGEVDDVIAAAAFLAKQPHVDPSRIYLGGHSTGGTLALLVSECSDRFRAVFSFGPAGDPRGYGSDQTPYPLNDAREVRLRAPELWLHSIRSPTFVFEGGEAPGNVGDLRRMARTNRNDKCRFYEVKGANHFNLLDALNRFVAERIIADRGPTCKLSFTAEEVNRAFDQKRAKEE